MNFKKSLSRKNSRASRPQLDMQVKVRPMVAASYVAAAHVLADVVWLLVMMFGLVLALALASFSLADPSWSRGIDHDGDIHNLLGPIGAYLSDFVYYLFGYSAWWLLPAALMWLYRNFRVFHVNQDVPYHLGRGLAGLAVLLFGSPLLEAALWADNLDDVLPVGAGGIIGNGIGSVLHGWLGFSGSLLLFVALILFGSHWMLQISWLNVFEKIGGQIHRWWRRLLNQPSDVMTEIPKEKFARRMVRQAQNITAYKVENLTGIVSNRQDGDIHIRTESPEAEVLQTDLFDLKLNELVQGYRLPDLGLLACALHRRLRPPTPDDLQYTAERIERILLDNGVQAAVIGAVAGPVVTVFEVETEQRFGALRYGCLPEIMAQALSVPSVRLTEAALTGGIIGIEIPNRHRQEVLLSEVLAAPVFARAHATLTVALGKDVAGFPVAADLARLPHLLLAGQRGSGKTSGLHSMLASLLYRATPEEVRLLLMETENTLSVYRNVPHLLHPVITEREVACQALDWCLAETEKRLCLLKHLGVSDLAAYNQTIEQAAQADYTLPDPYSANPDEPDALTVLPYCVVVVDEFDVLLPDEVRHGILLSLTEKAGAAGIHLILAASHPDVDAFTGHLKANIPARMTFAVRDRVASRAILDQTGAETLLQQGDLLFLQPNQADPVRIQGPFVADHEIEAVAAHCARQAHPEYLDGLSDGRAARAIRNAINPNPDSDILYTAALDFVLQSRKTSVSALQREFRIGYNRAARILQALETAGVLSSAELGGSRKILA